MRHARRCMHAGNDCNACGRLAAFSSPHAVGEVFCTLHAAPAPPCLHHRPRSTQPARHHWRVDVQRGPGQGRLLLQQGGATPPHAPQRGLQLLDSSCSACSTNDECDAHFSLQHCTPLRLMRCRCSAFALRSSGCAPARRWTCRSSSTWTQRWWPTTTAGVCGNVWGCAGAAACGCGCQGAVWPPAASQACTVHCAPQCAVFAASAARLRAEGVARFCSASRAAVCCRNIHDITLSYTFFKVEEEEEEADDVKQGSGVKLHGPGDAGTAAASAAAAIAKLPPAAQAEAAAVLAKRQPASAGAAAAAEPPTAAQ